MRNLLKDNEKRLLASSGTLFCCHRVCELYWLVAIVVILKRCFCLLRNLFVIVLFASRTIFFGIFGGNGVALHRCLSSSFVLCTRLFLASGFRSRELQRNEKRARATLLLVFFWPRSRSSGRVFWSYKTMKNGRQKSSEFDRF